MSEEKECLYREKLALRVTGLWRDAIMRDYNDTTYRHPESQTVVVEANRYASESEQAWAERIVREAKKKYESMDWIEVVVTPLYDSRYSTVMKFYVGEQS